VAVPQERGNIRGKKGKEAKAQDASRGRETVQDYFDGKSDAHAFRKAAPAGHKEGQPDAPPEKVETGFAGGRRQRAQDVAVRLKISRCHSERGEGSLFPYI
jgi:hypothetical protein